MSGGTCHPTNDCDGTVQVWDLPSGKRLLELRGHVGRVNSAAYSPDGRWIVTAGDDLSVRRWDAQTGGSLARMTGHEEPVTSALFSADGRWIATASLDRTARLWATPRPAAAAGTEESLIVLRGHRQSVTASAFSPDGRLVATGSEDETVRTWEMPGSGQVSLKARGIEDLRVLARARATRPLTSEERRTHLQQ